MTIELEPIVDNWYFHHDKGQKFKVVAVENDTIEIQHFDGDIEELSQTEWQELDIELSEEPQNWSGPIDVSELDDLGTEVTDTTRDEWDNGLDQFKQTKSEKLMPEI